VKDKNNVWLFVYACVPILLGSIASTSIYGFDFSNSDKLTGRLVAFLFGWSLGFVYQIFALGIRFGYIVDVIGEQFHLFRVLFRDGAAHALIRKILAHSEDFEKDTEHLNGHLQKLVQKWIEESLDETETECAGFASNYTLFDELRGMKIDQLLADSAERNIRASTHVTRKSNDFWANPIKGKQYRESCALKSRKLGPAERSGELKELTKGVARIFSIEIRDVEDAQNGSQFAQELIRNALNEARYQESLGIDIRILYQGSMRKHKEALLDVLIVDDLISSTTIDLEDGGVEREIEVCWNKSKVNAITRNWELLWSLGSTIDDLSQSNSSNTELRLHMNTHTIEYTTTKNVNPMRLEEIYFEYMYYRDDGRVNTEHDKIESHGVMHLGRRANWFREQLHNPYSHIELAMVRGVCIGFCLYYIGDQDCTHDTVTALRQKYDLQSAGYIYLVCVDEQWTKQRVGRSLVYRAMSRFQAEKVEMAIAEIAASPRKNMRSAHLFSHAGWTATGHLEDYYVNEQLVKYEAFEWKNSSVVTTTHQASTIQDPLNP